MKESADCVLMRDCKACRFKSSVWVDIDETASHTCQRHTAHTHPGRLTVTDPLADKAPHASGRVWYRGSPTPLLQAEPQNIHAASHTRVIAAVQADKQTSLTLPYKQKPLRPSRLPAFSFTPSLFFFFYPSLSASLLLPSAASQPIQ